MACPVCGDGSNGAEVVGRYRRVLARRPWSAVLVRCASCGHVRIDPPPTPSELAPYYESNYHVFAAQPEDAAAIAAAVRERGATEYNHVPILPGGTYLDVGCAVGNMVAVLGALGMRAQGVEVSPIAAGMARERGLEVFCGTLEEARFPAGTFDRVSLAHVLEHVLEPIPLLVECRRVLKRGGQLLILVPNFGSLIFERTGRHWVGLDLPRHVQQFTPRSLRRALEAAGFRVEAITTESYDGLTEVSLIEQAHRRSLVPRGLIRKSGVLATAARRLSERSNSLDRGDVIVARAGKGDDDRASQADGPT